jgi:hypothetical protein
MRSGSSPEREWARQWAETGAILADLRARDFSALTDREALAAADDLLALADPRDLSEARRTGSGLVEFQRLLHWRT